MSKGTITHIRVIRIACASGELGTGELNTLAVISTLSAGREKSNGRNVDDAGQTRRVISKIGGLISLRTKAFCDICCVLVDVVKRTR